MTPTTRYTEDDLRTLLRDGAGESQHLEFKRDFPLDAEEAKRTLAAHAAAMANAGGGSLIIGIDDDGKHHHRDDDPGYAERVVQSIAAKTDPQLPVGVERHLLDGGAVHVIGVPNRSSRPVAVLASTKRPEWIVPFRRSQTTDYLTFTEVVERIASGQGTRLRLSASAERIRAALGHAVEQLANSTYSGNDASESARVRFQHASNRVREAIEAIVFEMHLIPETAFTQPITAIKHEVLRAFDNAARELEQIERNIGAPVSAIRWDSQEVRSSFEMQRRDVDNAIEKLDTATKAVFGPDD